jgi:hypothetical protein
MIVRVMLEMNVEVNDPVFEELRKVHSKVECGTAEQYDRAIDVIENATGYKFYDDAKDESNHAPIRITCVTDTATEIDILEG